MHPMMVAYEVEHRLRQHEERATRARRFPAVRGPTVRRSWLGHPRARRRRRWTALGTSGG